MWKRNSQIPAPQTKSNIKRLHLDKKQNLPPLPVIQPKDQLQNNETQNQERNVTRAQSVKKKFSMTQKHRTMVPYLLKTPMEGQRSFRSLDKFRSQSDESQKQGPIIKRKGSQTRVRLISRNIMLQKQKKNQLHLQDHRQPILKSIQNNLIRQEKSNKKIQFVKTVGHSDSYIDSKQCTIFQDHTQQNQYDLINQQVRAAPKQFRSIGIETDFVMSAETFKDFIKFRITQKEKYKKMQQVFKFIDNISHQQLECFDQRYKKVKQLCKDSLQTIRQREIQNIINAVDVNESKLLDSMDGFVNSIVRAKQSQVSQNIIQIEHIKQAVHKLKKEINKLFEMKENQNSLQNTQPPVPRNQLIPDKQRRRSQKTPTKGNNKHSPKGKNYINLQLHERFSAIASQLTILQIKLKNQQKHITAKLNESQEEFKHYFNTWKQNLEEKNYAIQVCVGEVLRLPEMSLSIFGMKNDDDNRGERDMLKKIGVFLDNIPEFDEFYSNKNQKKQSSEYCFKEVLDFKCLNCAYLKSKMRFIYSKNKELESVTKILNYLAGSQKERKV